MGSEHRALSHGVERLDHVLHVVNQSSTHFLAIGENYPALRYSGLAQHRHRGAQA
jgi:hypothetical protein